MTEVQKLMLGIGGCIAAGFILVGTSKQQSNEDREAASMVRTVASMQGMAAKKCPKKIKEITGSQVFFASETESDKATYVTLKWKGEEKDNFKTAECTLHVSLGGISKLVIDGEAVIDKKI